MGGNRTNFTRPPLEGTPGGRGTGLSELPPHFLIIPFLSHLGTWGRVFIYTQISLTHVKTPDLKAILPEEHYTQGAFFKNFFYFPNPHFKVWGSFPSQFQAKVL